MSRIILIGLLLTPISVSANDLFTSPNAADVQTLVVYLGNASLRQGAASALAAIGQPAVKPLTEILNSDDLDTAIWSAYTLGKIGPDAAPAAKSLTDSLQSPDDDLRSVAARSLGQIRAADPATITALATLLTDENDRVRQQAASALGEIGPAAKKATSGLIAALADEPVRSHALKSLIQIGPTALPELRVALENDAVRLEAAQAIRAIDPAAARLAGVDKISHADLAALELSIANPHQDVATRIENVNYLTQLRADATPLLISVFDDETIEVSRAAALAFRQIGVVALPELQEALRHASPGVRSAATDALAAIGPAAQPAVEDLGELLSDPDRSVRYRAAFALDQLGVVADAAVPALIATMNNNREQEATRQMAIKALVQTSSATREKVIQAFRKVDDRGNYGVRNLVEEMLKQIARK